MDSRWNFFRFVFACVLSLAALFTYAQTSTDSLNRLLSANAMKDYKLKEEPKRRFVSMEGKSLVAKINPVNYIAGGALFVYQRVVSEQIQANCCYKTSCSNYAKASIEQYGFVKGLLLGIHQLNNCFGGASEDYPRFMLDESMRIINLPELKE